MGSMERRSPVRLPREACLATSMLGCELIEVELEFSPARFPPRATPRLRSRSRASRCSFIDSLSSHAAYALCSFLSHLTFDFDYHAFVAKSPSRPSTSDGFTAAKWMTEANDLSFNKRRESRDPHVLCVPM